MRTSRLELIIAIALTFLLGVACTSTPSTTKESPAPVTGETAGTVIGPEGGTVEHTSGAKIVVPPGALAKRTRLTLTSVQAPSVEVLAATPLGPSFEAGPDGQTFLKPVEIVLPFDPARLLPNTEAETAQVRMAPHGSTEFVALDSWVDVEARRIHTKTVHFTQFVPAQDPNPVFITTPSTLPDGTVGMTYAHELTAIGGSLPYTWSVSSAGGQLPAGLSLSPNGTLNGAPAATASAAFFLKVADSAGHAVQKAFSLTVMSGSNPIPTLDHISPNSALEGSGDMTLAVFGTDFLPSSVVQWAGSPLPTAFVSTTELAATISASLLAQAGMHLVSVFSPPPGGGTSAQTWFTITPGQQNPVPVITSVDPTSLPVTNVDTQITITGSSFLPTTSAAIGVQGLSTHYVSATELYATIPASYLGTAGTLEIGVYNPPPGGGFSVSTVTITVGSPAPVPTLASISPTSATAGSGNFTLTLTGTGFAAGGQAFFGTTALDTTVVSATSASALVPESAIATAGSYSVTFVNPAPGGGTSNPVTFTVNPPSSHTFCPADPFVNPHGQLCDPSIEATCTIGLGCSNIGGSMVLRTRFCSCQGNQWSCQVSHSPCP